MRIVKEYKHSYGEIKEIYKIYGEDGMIILSGTEAEVFTELLSHIIEVDVEETGETKAQIEKAEFDVRCRLRQAITDMDFTKVLEVKRVLAEANLLEVTE